MSSVCQRQNNIMSQLLADSGAFLFPCTIEYSLICAAILFIMWKNIAEEHEHYKVHSRRRKISRTLAPPITEHSGTILTLRISTFLGFFDPPLSYQSMFLATQRGREHCN